MSGPGHWVFTPRARRDFRRLDRPVQRRITEALDRLVEDPPRGDVRTLAGSEDEWRLRVGDWRVRFSRDRSGQRVEVLRVLPRGRAPRRRTRDGSVPALPFRALRQRELVSVPLQASVVGVSATLISPGTSSKRTSDDTQR